MSKQANTSGHEHGFFPLAARRTPLANSEIDGTTIAR
jgi:hypothetical protein